MRQRKKRFPPQQGAALLVLCYATAVALSGLTAAFLSRQTFDLRYATSQLERQQAHYLAEAGLEQAIDWLRTNPPPVGSAVDPWDGPQAVGNGTVQVTIAPDPNVADLYQVTAVGWMGTLSRTVQSGVQIPSFARYAYFSNSSSGNAWYGTGNEFWGPVHLNGNLQIAGKPIFHDVVSSTGNRIRYYNGNRDAVTPRRPDLDSPTFDKGLPQLKVAKRPFPKQIPDSMKGLAQADGTHWRSTTTITLQPGGTMKVTNPSAGLRDAVLALPPHGVVYVEGDLKISGNLEGKLTVVSTQWVTITDHLTYQHNPKSEPDSTDMLGLLSHEKITVAAGAPPDLRINGILMSLTGGLTVDRYNRGAPRGNLTLLGSMLEHQSYPKGLISPQTGRLTSGYRGRYIYDERSAVSPPPGFPSSGKPVELYRIPQ